MTPSGEVAAALATLPDDMRQCLLGVRDLVYQVADASEEIGPLAETLKWGQPSYLTARTKSGTTLRLWRRARGAADAALFVPCQTSVIDACRNRYPGLTYDGDRAIVLPVDRPLPEADLAGCIALALTYHRWKAARNGATHGQPA